MPDVFAAYVRVLFPFDGPGNTPVSWSQVATYAGRELTGDSASDDLLASIGDERRQQLRIDMLDMFAQGELPESVAQTLIDIMSSHTSAPEHCYFAVWEGYGGLADVHTKAAAFETPSRRWHLHTATVADAVASFQTRTSPGKETPDLWWPGDKRWFVGGDVDLPCAYIGCTEEVADEILASDLEAFRVDPQDRPRG